MDTASAELLTTVLWTCDYIRSVVIVISIPGAVWNPVQIISYNSSAVWYSYDDSGTVQVHLAATVYPRSEATATNCFTLQVKEATIRGRLLNEGGDYYLIIC